MDLLETTSNDKSMESTATPASSEDVLVVLQTESGEQIALPISALPSDFVPGDSGQIIMVESALDEQQEVVVESSDLADQQTNSENLVSLQQAEPTQSIHDNQTINSLGSTINDDSTQAQNADVINETSHIIQFQTTNSCEKPVPRTYSKSNSVVKSYAPTCGTTRIYQQQSATNSFLSSKEVIQNEVVESRELKFNNKESNQDDLTIQNNPMTKSYSQIEEQQQQQQQQQSTKHNNVPIQVVKEPHKKQKRKEALITRPLNDEDLELDFQIIEEPLPIIQETEVKRKPRKEYKTKKKVRLAMERLSKEEGSISATSQDMEVPVKRLKRLSREDVKEAKKEQNKKDALQKDKIKKETAKESKREITKRELPKRGTKEKLSETTTRSQQQSQPEEQELEAPPSPTTPLTTPQPLQSQPERRTRLSNACRVATGKSYKCNDCGFSTDRINNIVLHVKESCPKLSKRT